MDFTLSERQTSWRDRVAAFMNEHVVPAEPVYAAQMQAFGLDRWQAVPIVEELKACARSAGLWNLFLPKDSVPEGSAHAGAGLARQFVTIRAMRIADGPDEVHKRSIARMEYARYETSRNKTAP